MTGVQTCALPIYALLYLLGGEELTLNSRGESVISYADYAIAIVDEIEQGNHVQQRISVVRK